jgi:hypothetical protein
MRIYIRDVKDVDNNIQVINTKTGNDVTFLPGIGEIVLDDYIVVKKEWKTIAQDNGKLIVWCKKLGKITLHYLESVGMLSRDFNVIQEKTINESDLYSLPNAGDKIWLGDIQYSVESVKREWKEGDISEVKVYVKK